MDYGREALKGAARDIAKEIHPSTVMGLGSGSTIAALLEELAPLIAGRGERMGGVPTSSQIESVATRSGVGLIPFRGAVDLVVDGADQVDLHLNLIKGGGGALLREKVVMGSARRIVVLASENKFAEKLGEGGVRVPVEVHAMAKESAKARLKALGGTPEERLLQKGFPYFTENGNVILDTAFAPVDDPGSLEAKVKGIPGVMEVGIFTFKPITVYKLKGGGKYEVLRSDD